MNKTGGFTFGRFNPPHCGHKRITDLGNERFGDDYFVFVSSKHDTTNPMSTADKLQFMNTYVAPGRCRTVDVAGRRGAFSCIEYLVARGYKQIFMVVGGDYNPYEKGCSDVDKISRLRYITALHKHAAGLGACLSVTFVSRSYSGEGTSSLSATAARVAAKNNDLESFIKCTGWRRKIATKLLKYVIKTE